MKFSFQRDNRFFGHPLGLAVLAGTEIWERFSFFGMQALLMLYMTKHVMLLNHNQVFGMITYRAMISHTFGTMSDLAFAAQTVGIYSGLTYVTPLVGSWLADRFLGKTRTVTIGALIMTVGHFSMAIEQLFLIALMFLIIGAGLVTGNLAAQVGQLYGHEDDRRTRAFGIYLIALNIGALLAPLVCGTLGEKIAWHWGFGAAGVGMLIGLTIYLAGRGQLPSARVRMRSKREPLDRADWRRIAGILLALAPYTLTFAAFNQAYGLMLVWADKSVRHDVLGWRMPITWVLTADGIFSIVGISIATTIWKRLAVRGREPHDIAKVAVGCTGIALAFLCLAIAARAPIVSMPIFIGFYAIMDLAVGWIEAPTASLTSCNAPPQVNATMMAVYKLAYGLCYFLMGWMARFFEPLGPSGFWLLNAGLAGTGLVILLLGRRTIVRMLSIGAT